MNERYLIRWRGKTSGPYSMSELRDMLAQKEIGLFHELQKDGTWVTLQTALQIEENSRKTITEITSSPVVSHRPASSKQVATRTGMQVPRSKSRVIFALLGMGLGFMGIHNFYNGAWIRGSLQALLSCLGFLLGFGVIASWVWALFEVLLITPEPSTTL